MGILGRTCFFGERGLLPVSRPLVRCPRPGANIEAHPRFNPRTYRRGLVCGLDEGVLRLTGGFGVRGGFLGAFILFLCGGGISEGDIFSFRNPF